MFPCVCTTRSVPSTDPIHNRWNWPTSNVTDGRRWLLSYSYFELTTLAQTIAAVSSMACMQPQIHSNGTLQAYCQRVRFYSLAIAYQPTNDSNMHMKIAHSLTDLLCWCDICKYILKMLLNNNLPELYVPIHMNLILHSQYGLSLSSRKTQLCNIKSFVICWTLATRFHSSIERITGSY